MASPTIPKCSAANPMNHCIELESHEVMHSCSMKFNTLKKNNHIMGTPWMTSMVTPLSSCYDIWHSQ